VVIDLKIRNKIVAERRCGKAIPLIASELGLPKSTVWRYTHGVRLSVQQREALRKSQGGGTKHRLLREQRAVTDSAKLVKSGYTNKVDPFLLAMLYWAEGTKSSFVFTNTDPDMIRVFLKILRCEFGVTDDRLQVMIRLGDTFNPAKECKYWSEITGIPVHAIRCNINSQYNRTTVKHGLCRITLAKGAQMLKVMQAMRNELTRYILSV
jgi:hypothetical protein